ncbi:DNA-binding LacI/PurR family transcriptional regulator [Paenibacillus phyllosphaerae]|uniref:DNA-binding LacI/PurR family transcriptional regulator n=1 Tax=Paenibacillus phyllosphaerae TaxID=274593 RepID=A0A7W5B3X2_9BACL|nr:LacI family DNA-binding transcriptional regulator [Paenibacillus phyllosphaerae]MBB3113709.1 DNA-binding LacI/PurR family transcriptional regulator [Paenibacillus phyllosphaerae]
MKKVTLQMIADKLEVSKALVSKALSNDPAVNEGTRETIWRTAEEMGYRMKLSRKTVPASRTGNLAVLMPRAYLDDMEYWGKVLHGIEKELMEYSFSMILSTIDIALTPKEGLPSSIHERKVDGAIVMGHLPDSYINQLRDNDFPFMMVDANLLDPSVDHVLANNFLGAYQATMHLLEAGHTRIAYVGDEDTSWSFRERSRGFEEAIRTFNRSKGLQISGVKIEGVGVSGNGMYVTPEFPQALKEHTTNEQPITALFCANDLTAFEALRFLGDIGVNCPEHISVIGFDDLTLTEIMQPRLTTVRVPKQEIGSRAADLILRRITDPEAVAEHVLLSTELVQRASVRPYKG